MVIKRAFTMIELIFAIVIIGITVAGVSAMMTRSANTIEGATSQEAVFLAAMEGARIFSHRWDKNSEDNSSELPYSKIVDTGVGGYQRTCINVITGARTETAVDCIGTNLILSPQRLGGIREDLHRSFHGDWTGVAMGAADYGVPDGVPNGSIDLNVSGSDTYTRSYKLSRNSGFVNFNANGFNTQMTAGPTDIKMSVITIDSVENGVTTNLVTMRVYSYNVGETGYASRPF